MSTDRHFHRLAVRKLGWMVDIAAKPLERGLEPVIDLALIADGDALLVELDAKILSLQRGRDVAQWLLVFKQVVGECAPDRVPIVVFSARTTKVLRVLHLSLCDLGLAAHVLLSRGPRAECLRLVGSLSQDQMEDYAFVAAHGPTFSCGADLRTRLEALRLEGLVRRTADGFVVLQWHDLV